MSHHLRYVFQNLVALFELYYYRVLCHGRYLFPFAAMEKSTSLTAKCQMTHHMHEDQITTKIPELDNPVFLMV